MSDYVWSRNIHEKVQMLQGVPVVHRLHLVHPLQLGRRTLKRKVIMIPFWFHRYPRNRGGRIHFMQISCSSGNAFVSGPEICGLNLGLVKLDRVLPTSRHRCDISLKGAGLSAGAMTWR